MTTDLQIPDAVNLTPFQALMIPVALVGAVFLSLGAQFQSRGVQRVEARLGRQSKGLSLRHVLALVSSGYWVLGTVMLGVAVVLQLVSITFAPLIVVQPLGAVALVVTTWFSSRATGVPLGHRARRAVWTCIIGVGIFVGIAAFVGHESAITRQQLITVLVILAVAFIGIGWIVEGVMSLVESGRARSSGWAIAYGILSILAGLVVLVMPASSTVFLILFAAVALIVLGIIGIVRAFTFGREVLAATSTTSTPRPA